MAEFAAHVLKAMDMSVFDEDVCEVVQRLVDWYTGRRHELHCGWNPFAKWYPTRSPVVDMSWLAFGFDRQTASYSMTYKYYAHYEVATSRSGICACTGSAVAAKAKQIIRIMAEAKCDLWDTELFQVALTCLRLLARHMFPCAPLLAHHWMIGGRFIMVNQWAMPKYPDDVAFYQPCFDFMNGMALMMEALNTSSHPSHATVDPPPIELTCKDYLNAADKWYHPCTLR